ncbi:MAG: MGMT family protein [Acidimicrobiales bacterium]
MTPDPTVPAAGFDAAVVRVLRSTGPGDVVTYGEVAAEAGYPGAARAVGNLLGRLHDVPWWRVVTASGRLIPHDPDRHAGLLAAEGVRCRDGHVVGWGGAATSRGR